MYQVAILKINVKEVQKNCFSQLKKNCKSSKKVIIATKISKIPS